MTCSILAAAIDSPVVARRDLDLALEAASVAQGSRIPIATSPSLVWLRMGGWKPLLCLKTHASTKCSRPDS